jgi:hypothetical protein
VRRFSASWVLYKLDAESQLGEGDHADKELLQWLIGDKRHHFGLWSWPPEF